MTSPAAGLGRARVLRAAGGEAAAWRRYWVVAGVIALLAVVVPLAVLLLAPRR